MDGWLVSTNILHMQLMAGVQVTPIGALAGVAVGSSFNSKAQMAHIGVHTNPM